MKTAVLLRAVHQPTAYDYLHSGLTERLRADVLEAEYLFGMRLAHMIASCALASHPNADLKAASNSMNTTYLNALASIPYLTGGRSGTQMIEDDRMAAIEEYKRMRDRILKKKGPDNAGAVPKPGN